MNKPPYSVTRSGRVIIHDPDALRTRQRTVMAKLDRIAGRDEFEYGDFWFPGIAAMSEPGLAAALDGFATDSRVRV